MTLKEMQACAAETLSYFLEVMPDVPFGKDDIVIEFAKRKVRVNAIAPGMIMTDMSKSLDQSTMDQKMMGAMAQHSDLTVPPCQAEDVANVALFLASDEARALDGQIIVADFGANL